MDLPPGDVRQVQGVLTGDETWEGIIEVTDDLLVPQGVTLTIRPGSRVRVVQADTGRTEPEFLDNATEILVRGRLLAGGGSGERVTFEPAGPAGVNGDPRWAGIIFDGGKGALRRSVIRGSEYGLLLLSSSPRVEEVIIEGVKHGIMLYGPSRPLITGTEIAAAEGGIYCWRGSAPELVNLTVRAGEREGLLVAPGADPLIRDSLFEGPLGGILRGEVPTEAGKALAADEPERIDLPDPRSPRKIYRGENFIGRDETWEGEILVDGTVMVAPGARLTVRPGTVVRFTFRDTNGDGIGENEIFIQGRILARGEKGNPIVFTAEGRQGPGRWGAVNIMGSEEEENILAFCHIQSSYRGLHSHFSTFRVEDSTFRGNYRALQFQESRAVISGASITGNGSGLRFRDSTVVIENCRITENTWGLQTLRSQVSLTGSAIEDNVLAGVHLRETEGVVAGNVLTGNSPGLRASGGRLRLENNVLSANSFGGLQLRESDAEIRGNRIAGNVGNGFFTDSPMVVLRNNLFDGNLRFAVENNSAAPVDGALNYWGADSSEIAGALFDRGDDPSVGPVLVEPQLETPPDIP